MITREALSEFLCSTIALACNRERLAVSPETSLLELCMDSLTFVSVLAQLETIFAFELSPDDILALFEADNVADLTERVGLLRAR
jgi:acyl carrier protein